MRDDKGTYRKQRWIGRVDCILGGVTVGNKDKALNHYICVDCRCLTKQ